MLDYRIESFLMVCRTMSITRAAEALHITQPAVSQHIKVLEKQYGAALFSYRGKKLALTQAGRMLCQAARTMRQDAAQLQKRIASLGGEQPVLRFGATLTVGEYAMPPVLARYLKQHPDAQISMHVADTEQLLRALDDGAIDFAIVEGAFSQSVYDSLLFCTERFLPVCGADYPLPAAAYRIHDLLTERLLVREQGSGTRHILEHYLEGKNLTIQDFACRVEASSLTALKTLAKAGCGITFLYETAVREELAQGTLRAIPLADFDVRHDFSFLWRKGSQFAEQYKEIYRDFLQRI